MTIEEATKICEELLRGRLVGDHAEALRLILDDRANAIDQWRELSLDNSELRTENDRLSGHRRRSTR